MNRHIDAWRGFQVDYPEGWRVLYPPIEGVAFDGTAFLELSFVDAPDARTALMQRLHRFQPHEARQLPSAPDEAAVLFRQPDFQGQLRVRWARGRATVAMVQARDEADLTGLLQSTLRTLRPHPPVRRQTWQEPSEASLTLLCPEGWQPQAGVFGPPGTRQPMARVSRDPQVWAAAESEFQVFREPNAWGMEPVLPFRGLGPLVEHVLGPRWQQQGCKVLGFEDFGQPDRAEVRLAGPDGTFRVVMLQAVQMGQGRWLGGIAGTIQGPPELEPILRGVLASIKINPRWRAGENAVFQHGMALQQQQSQQWMQLQTNMHNQRMHDIQMQGLNNTQIHQQRQDIADASMAGYWRNSETQAEMHHDTINSIRERTDYVDPLTGQVHNLPSHHERVWTDGQEHFLAAPWSFEPPPDWHEVRPLK